MSMPTQVSEELPTLCRNQLPTNLGECLDSDNRGRFFWAQTGKPRTLIHSFIRQARDHKKPSAQRNYDF